MSDEPRVKHVHVWMWGILVFTGTDLKIQKYCTCGGTRLFDWKPLD